MEKDEKVKQVRKGGQLIEEKLKRGILLIGKREGNSTPSPTWLYGLIQPDGTLIPDFDFSSYSGTLSARKLGANLWEMLPQDSPSLAKLSKIGPMFGRQKQGNISSKELNQELAELGSGINLGGRVAESPTQHNLQVRKVVQAQQPLSPASYCSSMEMPPYRPVISTSGFLVSNGKHGKSSQSLKTSTELLKVLNRIWRLEEKHALDMSLVKMLRRELDQSLERIQELQQQKEIDQTEINNLKKQLSEYKAAGKKEKGRLKDAVKVVEDEVEDEYKLRRNSEKGLDHELDKVLLDSKSLLSNTLMELERERKARALLEALCDEFAKGITDYEQEIRSMKHRYCKDQIGGAGENRLILHISEAWLDQRSQMKLSDAHDVSEKQLDLDKMCFEIEGFLQAKQSGNSGKDDCLSAKNPCESNTLMQSLELFHWNEPTSTPWKIHGEDDSVKVTAKLKTGKKKVQPGMNSDPSTSLLQLELEHVNKGKHEGINDDGESTRSRTDASLKKTNSRTPKKRETMQRSPREGKNKITDTNVDLHNTTTVERINKLKNKMEGTFDPSSFMGIRSPVKKWISNASITDPDISGAPSKWPGSVRSSSLKAKLMESRIEGQQSRPGISGGSSLKIE